MKEIDNLPPAEIERRSFELIEQELKREIPEKIKPIVKRVIHTTADFSYEESLVFSSDAVDAGLSALKRGSVIVSDTNMVKAGINQAALNRYGGEVVCFMADEDVVREAKVRNITRASVSMEKAAKRYENPIFAIGNAPTALIMLYNLIQEGKVKPSLIIGVPVGFVNVVESKEMILSLKIPYIVARGRKGGSNVAAAIVNALMYMGSGE